jgi:hypothetical protein
VFADVTSETASPCTPNNMPVFITDVPAKRAPTNRPLSFKIGQVSHFLILSHVLSFNTVASALTQALQSKQMEEHSVLPIEVLSI